MRIIKSFIQFTCALRLFRINQNFILIRLPLNINITLVESLTQLKMPAKKAAKTAKAIAKITQKNKSLPRSSSRNASNSLLKTQKGAKIQTKIDAKISISLSQNKASKVITKKVKNNVSPVKNNLKKSISSAKKNPTPAKKDDTPLKKNVTPTKKDVTPTKKDVTPAKKDVSPAKGKRDKPSKNDSSNNNDTKVDATVKKTSSKEQIVKVITKGGAAVDSFVPNCSAYRVLVENGKVYSATLNQSNLDANNNKFYIIQALIHEATGVFMVWNRWGRVGVPGQNANRGPFNKAQAMAEFNSKLNEKTVKGNYKEIQIKYDDDEPQKKQETVVKKGPKKEAKSQIDESLQRLMGLIFDVNIMNNTMKEIGYDAKRMPLGKLGDSTIKQAYAVLNKLSEAIKKKQTSQFKSLSSEFYTLIPHNFGFQKMANFVLDNEEKVKEKLKMLETISDMKITTKLLEQKANDEEAIHDQNYKKLGCQIKSLKQDSNDFKQLVEYFDNTKGSFGKVKIADAFEVVRPDQQKVFNQKLGNNMLLWHGSRISNFVGILSQGLRIAPPEAPVSGYLFGKGIYLADMAEKSIHYCRSHGSDTALILLIEGAIGDPNVLLQSSYNAKELMQKNNKHSTKCHGSKAPPESSYVKLNGMTMPKGKPVPTGSGSYMGHNEYIVYNIDQARIRYILRMDMKGQ